MVSAEHRPSSIVIQNNKEKNIAVIEAEVQRNMTSDDAIQMRVEKIKKSLPPRLPYFLILAPDKGFLWKNKPSLTPTSPPDYEFSMGDLMQRFASRNYRGFSLETMDKMNLATLLASWLYDMDEKSFLLEEPEKTLNESGFLNAIKHGAIMVGDVY